MLSLPWRREDLWWKEMGSHSCWEGTLGGLEANVHHTARAAIRSHQVAQGVLHVGFELFQGLTQHNITGQSAPVLHSLHG